VFTDHLTYFPDFMDKNQIISLQPYIDKDGLDMNKYYAGLADIWKDQEGNSFGLPKDWDTIAFVYNTEMMEEAGYTKDELFKLTWNPTDGGSYEKMIAHLTIDQNGVRGDEPGFDKTKVATYGMAMEGADAGFSQTQLSPFLFTTGWNYTDKNPWGTKYNFSDSRYKDTLAWYRSLIEKGYMNNLETSLSMDSNALEPFGNKQFATVMVGDWVMSSYEALEGIDVAFAPTPIGPEGERASMFNGLTDAITTSSDHPDQAWEWVKYLGSEACQQVVADSGVVFPAISTLSEETLKTHEAKGRDVSAFTIHLEDGTTHQPPITQHFPDVVATLKPALDAVLNGSAGVESMDAINDKINALFK
jgi:multiple sugar transport system substrate-binding protein